MPFDTIKTRRQAALVSSTESTTNSTLSLRTAGLVRHIIQTEGAKALFAGLTPRVAKIAPACGIMIACYEVGYCLYAQVYMSTNVELNDRALEIS